MQHRLLDSILSAAQKMLQRWRLEVDFADFAITALIFDSVFVESLHLGKGGGEATRRLVEEIAARKHKPVGVKDIMKDLKVSKDKPTQNCATPT